MISLRELLENVAPTRRGFLQGTAAAATSPMLPGQSAPTFGAEQFLSLLEKARNIDKVTGDDWPLDEIFYDLRGSSPEEFAKRYQLDHVRSRVIPYLNLMNEAPPEISNYMQHGATAFNLEEMIKNYTPLTESADDFALGTSGHNELYWKLRKYSYERESMTPEEITSMKAELDQRLPAMLEWAAKQTGARYVDTPKLDISQIYKMFEGGLPEQTTSRNPGLEPYIPETTSLSTNQMVQLMLELYETGGRRHQPDVTELLNSPELPNLLGEG